MPLGLTLGGITSVNPCAAFGAANGQQLLNRLGDGKNAGAARLEVVELEVVALKESAQRGVV